jgi:hypothetical protein
VAGAVPDAGAVLTPGESAPTLPLTPVITLLQYKPAGRGPSPVSSLSDEGLVTRAWLTVPTVGTLVGHGSDPDVLLTVRSLGCAGELCPSDGG